MPDGPLHAAAREEIYLAKGSPRVELEPLLALLARAPDLPKADQLARLALARGAASLPPLPEPRALSRRRQPRRARARVRAIRSPTRSTARSAADRRRTSRPTPRRSHQPRSPSSPPMRRPSSSSASPGPIIVGDGDAAARPDRRLARNGPTDGRCRPPGPRASPPGGWANATPPPTPSPTVAARTSDYELSPPADYWGARADTMCGHPERVETKLRARRASRRPSTACSPRARSACSQRAAA